MGIGGCCALFYPQISSLDNSLMSVTSDMGGIYISNNYGESFKKHNLNGRVYAQTFDPVDENVVYAGGSGIYKSIDKGNSFTRIFPKDEDLYATMTKDENNRFYYYSNDMTYPTYLDCMSIAVNPLNNNEVYGLYYYYGQAQLYYSSDAGQEFNMLCSFENKYIDDGVTRNGTLNKLFYDVNNNRLIICKDDGIFYLDGNEIKELYLSSSKMIDVTITDENKETYFIILEKNCEIDKSNTALFYTSNFDNKTYLNESLLQSQLHRQYTWDERELSFDWNFENVAATSINNIYLTNGSQATYLDTEAPYPWAIDSIIRYNNGEWTWVYGLPSKTSDILVNKGWIDGAYNMYGITVDPNNKDAFLFTTIAGVYYASDNNHIYERYTTVVEKDNEKYYTSNGIDAQTTYKVLFDPFDNNHLLILNTDLGLTYSYDNGKTYKQTDTGVEKWGNTIYDAHFNKNQKGILYGLWSSRHDAPYYVDGDETNNRYGGFAISYDGGVTWDSTYSSGIPQSAIPVNMSVEYNNDNQLTIYVATFNEGFFVSYDNGKTFSSLNDGITPLIYKNNQNEYEYIYGADIVSDGTKVYGLVSKTNYHNEVQPGGVYELVNNEWKKIELPENVTNPRDIYLHEGLLYISCTATNKYNWNTPITNYDNVGGGIYVYDGTSVTNIFDEKIAVAGVSFDNRGTMFLSDIIGNVYYRNKKGEYIIIYEEFHTICKGITIENNMLFLPSFGGGILKIEISY